MTVKQLKKESAMIAAKRGNRLKKAWIRVEI